MWPRLLVLVTVRLTVSGTSGGAPWVRWSWPWPSRWGPTTPTTTPTASAAPTTPGWARCAWWRAGWPRRRRSSGPRWPPSGWPPWWAWPWPGRRRGGSSRWGRRAWPPAGSTPAVPGPTGTPGWGELFVFVFFGLVATVGTFYVESLHLDEPVVWFAAVAVGLLATGAAVGQQPAGHRHGPRQREADAGGPGRSPPRGLALRGLRRPSLRGGVGVGAVVGDRGRARSTGRPSPSSRWRPLPLVVAAGPAGPRRGRGPGPAPRAGRHRPAPTGLRCAAVGVAVAVGALALPWGLP